MGSKKKFAENLEIGNSSSSRAMLLPEIEFAFAEKIQMRKNPDLDKIYPK